MIDAIKSCHRTARNRFRNNFLLKKNFFEKMKDRGVVSELSVFSLLPRVIDLQTSKQQQQHKPNRKFNERTMSSCQKQKQRVSEIREKFSSTRKHHSSVFYILFILLTFCVRSSLCNSPPRFVLESSNAEVVGGDIVVRLKEGQETPPGSKIYSLRGFDSDGDRLLFGVQKGRDSDLIKVVNQVFKLSCIFSYMLLNYALWFRYKILSISLSYTRWNSTNLTIDVHNLKIH